MASVALAGCSTSGDDMQTSFGMTPDMASEQAFALPDTVSVLPASFPSDAREIIAAAPEADVTPLAAAEERMVTETAPGMAPGQPDLDAAAVASLAEEKAARPSLIAAAFSASTIERADTPRGKVERLIDKYAAVYDIPADLVRKVVKRESNFDPDAYNRGHWGLMQIKHATARGMGYKGAAKGLLDPETNLKYAVRYLAGAYLVADGNHKLADRLYQRGYYYDAKRKGLLDETGLGRDRVRRKG